ncbi:TetR/AcrR family transcriptional regulator [Deinococcus pimensis]|uniref:TetR/AcrR family transcriptional regulator n=1 Tax=Deinococcus pimensis TaxID=309888 RepID=UPI000481BCE3|nr:TetR/AcrR family transcriptional regulator [Deinococcus pimensis]
MGDPATTASKADRILDAAARSFAERGYHATTTKDVAREAGVAEGTIYNHFENKGALLLALLDRLTTAARSAVDPAEFHGLDTRRTLTLLLTHALRGFSEGDLTLFRVVMSEILVNPDLGARFRERLLAPMLEGPRPLLPGASDLASRAVAALVIGMLVQRALGDPDLDAGWADLPARLADLLAPGLEDGRRS